MSTMVLLNGVRELPCALENVLEYRNPVLAQRFQQKLGISQEVAEQLFEDTKKFLYLCAASEKPISPNKTLDFGWHEFILFTEDYTDFCQKYFGHFIHHRPRHPNDPPTKREGGRRDPTTTGDGHQSGQVHWLSELHRDVQDPLAEGPERCGEHVLHVVRDAPRQGLAP